jgi:hypothetical protein
MVWIQGSLDITLNIFIITTTMKIEKSFLVHFGYKGRLMSFY